MKLTQFIVAGLCSLVMIRADESVTDNSVHSIKVFVKSLQDNTIETVGSIQYNTNKKRAEFVYNDDKEIQLNKGSGYCFGTEDIPNHECFAYVEGNNKSIKSKNFHLFTNEQDEISQLSISNEDGDKPKVIIHNVVKSPVPNLNAESIKGQKQNQKAGPKIEKVVQKKVVKYINDEGIESEKEIEEEVEVEVDDRSWIQKNWMYIVPTLILFLLMGDEKKE
ncbi:uncharacterized protein RJT21DRAFT_414 [Scheffersomyces amazonensis]|uniref:uncharacterized protein n=1 Tax=Scheffersomyces amazonensis TaxID=1078765 RepID=UPI00315D7421